jgi:hypothetical protein
METPPRASALVAIAIAIMSTIEFLLFFILVSEVKALRSYIEVKEPGSAKVNS